MADDQSTNPPIYQATVDDLRWDDRGLLPAVVQDGRTGAVLMVAWMNAVALRLTLATGETHFWSRSRGELWHKGATSGNTQRVTGLWTDCDGDTLLVQVVPAGPACHTGAASCFYRPLQIAEPGTEFLRETGYLNSKGVLMSEIMQSLWATIQDRQRTMPAGSYTASLLAAGLPRIAQKVGEEAVETAVAALSEGNDRVIYEMADLVYHCLVLLAARGLTWTDIEAELGRRFR